MACACKVGQQMTYLQKKYGSEQPPQSKKTHIIDLFKQKVRNIGYYLLLLPTIPFMVIFILIQRIKGIKSINIEKTFKLHRDG